MYWLRSKCKDAVDGTGERNALFVDLLEDVLETAVILFHDGVLRRHELASTGVSGTPMLRNMNGDTAINQDGTHSDESPSPPSPFDFPSFRNDRNEKSPVEFPGQK